MALLDAIMDGLTNPKDGALRDMCANLLDEFLKWSIKHDKSNKFVNVKSLFQRLYSSIHHPNLHKRLGAALAFNRMYRTFREVDELVDKYVLELLHNVIVSLRMETHSDDSSMIGVVEQSVELLRHVEKMITFKSRLLLAEKENRGFHPNLPHAVQWIFQQCGNFEVVCREQCMKLFISLCMLLPDFNTQDGPHRWLQSKLKREGISFVLEVAEKFSAKKEMKSFPSMLQWLIELEASLDCYTWMFQQQLIAPHQIFKSGDQMEDINEQSQIFTHIGNFIDKLKEEKAFAPHEEAKYIQRKCSVIQKLLKFLTIMVEKYNETLSKHTPNALNPKLFELVFTCILAPQRLGFNTHSEQTQQVLPRITKRFLQNCQTHQIMIKTLSKMLSKDSALNIFQFDISSKSKKSRSFTNDSGDMNIDDATFMCRGFRLLHLLGILEKAINENLTQLATRLGTKLFEYGKTMNPVQQVIARELWEFCFDLKFPTDVLVTFLMVKSGCGCVDIDLG